MKQHSEKYWKWRTYTVLFVAAGLIIWAVGCNGNTAYSQQTIKDSLPQPQPKRYVFVMDELGYRYMDSILKLFVRTAGYELNKKDADGLINGGVSIINFFAAEKYRQDTTNANPKK